MPTKRHDITVNQGAKFDLTVQALNPDRTVMDLTGYSAKMAIRETITSLTTLMLASTTDGTITINSPGGLVMVEVPATITAPMTWNTGVYDLVIYNSTSNIIRLVQGYASLSLEVTS